MTVRVVVFLQGDSVFFPILVWVQFFYHKAKKKKSVGSNPSLASIFGGNKKKSRRIKKCDFVSFWALGPKKG